MNKYKLASTSAQNKNFSTINLLFRRSKLHQKLIINHCVKVIDDDKLLGQTLENYHLCANDNQHKLLSGRSARTFGEYDTAAHSKSARHKEIE